MDEQQVCPIGKKLGSVCEDADCLYFIHGKCEYRAGCVASSIEERADRMQAVCDLYQVTEDSVRERMQSIALVVLLNAYFEFLFQKPLLDCRSSEVQALRASELKYYQWRQRTTPPFSQVMEVLDFILPRL